MLGPTTARFVTVLPFPLFFDGRLFQAATTNRARSRPASAMIMRFITGFDFDIIRWGNNPPQRDRNGYDTCDVLFGAAHGTGVNLVLADGSAAFVNYSVDPPAFRRASQRDDGQPGGLP
jgi:prepilin-type processing-associated H-X9-DG protein